MNTFAIDNRVENLNQKIDDNKKPISYVTVGGIVLAVISFLLFMFLLLRLIFGIGLAIFTSLQPAISAHASALSATKNGSASPAHKGGFKAAPTHAVYANPLHSGAGKTHAVYANKPKH